MDKSPRIYSWYLILNIILQLFGLLMSVIFILFKVPTATQFLIGLFTAPIIWGQLILDIVMLIIVLVNKIERIALLLIGLNLFGFVLSLIIGVFLIIVYKEASGQHFMNYLIPLIFSGVSLFISFKLLLRKPEK